MGFKIDAKEQYTVITPENTCLDSVLAADLSVQCTELTQNGSNNFIVDLSACQSVSPGFLEPFVSLASSCYEKGQSFVLVHAPADMLGMLKEHDAVDALNYAPTLIEAIDIVSMEILERDLFNEE